MEFRAPRPFDCLIVVVVPVVERTQKSPMNALVQVRGTRPQNRSAASDVLVSHAASSRLLHLTVRKKSELRTEIV